MLIDSHCHLNYVDFRDDLEVCLKRAWDLGVRGFLTINTRLNEAKDLQNIADTHKNVACTVGVHPHEAKDYLETSLCDDIFTLAAHPKVVGIGETGLDYYYNHSDQDAQKWSFGGHLLMARALDLPVIIHTRDADEDTIATISDTMSYTSTDHPYKKECTQSMEKLWDLRGVFHCFSGTKDLCRQALDLGFYISLSGIVTFKKAEALRKIAAFVPLDRLLVETDAPFLAPIPHRGKRNEPAFVTHTAECIADLRGIPFPKLCDATTENFFNLFTKTKEFFV
jgi:TatD DNase family protein